VDIEGNEVLKTNYGYADDFIDGVAKVKPEFGGETLFIDTKGKLVDCDKDDIYNSKFKEIKNGELVDLSIKMKEYTAQDEEVDYITLYIEEYDVGDEFIIKVINAGGAPQRFLLKDGEKFFPTKEWNKDGNKEIWEIVKYDDEKMFRFSYIDYLDDGKYKTTYIDYKGNYLFTKPAQDGIKVIFNGKTMVLKNAPVMQGKTVLLPAGEILQKLGYKVTWSTKTGKLKAAKKSSVINISANSKKALVNKKTVSMSNKAIVINKKLFISPSQLMKKLSVKYSWDADTSTITIQTKNAPK
jgi:hypothetical protein